ncbi:hypothetical protein BESB_063020 [Besnoitia besnoiti]|uniref:CRAL-TRIO domain-containing protein n=1 Tax=Besnoitia besnoiti TaxID=94643 RepID=A0A2A9MBR3_BESBE|nr:hypothetical protein BESB_063020 [Besnoitia besnoiti]PFH35415.1 hypothetical protein BESB_063020 [Besnoitia besnoiti]
MPPLYSSSPPLPHLPVSAAAGGRVAASSSPASAVRVAAELSRPPGSPREAEGRCDVEAEDSIVEGRVVEGNLIVRGGIRLWDDEAEDNIDVREIVSLQGPPPVSRGPSPAARSARTPGEDAAERDEETAAEAGGWKDDDGEAEVPNRRFKVRNLVTIEGSIPALHVARFRRDRESTQPSPKAPWQAGFSRRRRQSLRRLEDVQAKFVASFLQDGEVVVNAKTVLDGLEKAHKRDAALRRLDEELADTVPGSLSGRVLLPYTDIVVRELLLVSHCCGGQGWRVLEELRRLLVLRRGHVALPPVDRGAKDVRLCLAQLASLKQVFEARAHAVLREEDTMKLAVSLAELRLNRQRNAGFEHVLDDALDGLHADGNSADVDPSLLQRLRPGQRNGDASREELIKEIRQNLSIALAYCTKGKKQPAVYLQIAAMKPSVAYAFLGPTDLSLILLEVFQGLWCRFVEFSLRRQVRVSTAALVLDFSSLTERELTAGSCYFLLSSLRDVLRAFCPLLIKKIIFYNAQRARESLWAILRPAIEHNCFFAFCESEEALNEEIEGDRPFIFHTTGLANEMALLTCLRPLYTLREPPLPSPEQLSALRICHVAPHARYPGEECEAEKGLADDPRREAQLDGPHKQLFFLLGAGRVLLSTVAGDDDANLRASPEHLAQSLAARVRGRQEESDAWDDQATKALKREEALIRRLCNAEGSRFWCGMNDIHDVVFQKKLQRREAAAGVDAATDEEEEAELDLIDPDAHMGPSQESPREAAAEAQEREWRIRDPTRKIDEGARRRRTERIFERVFKGQEAIEKTIEEIGGQFEETWERSVQKGLEETYLEGAAGASRLSTAGARPLPRPFPIPLDLVDRRPVSAHFAPSEDALLDWELPTLLQPNFDKFWVKRDGGKGEDPKREAGLAISEMVVDKRKVASDFLSSVQTAANEVRA